MTYELLLKPLAAERKPWLLLLLTFIIGSLAIILSYRIFPDSSSVLIVTFSIIPLIPLMAKLIELEELKTERARHWYSVKHYKFLRAYAFLFIGFVIVFSAWYTFLPTEKGERYFAEQIYTLENGGPLQAAAVCDTGYLSQFLDDFVIHDCDVLSGEKYLLLTDEGQFVLDPATDRKTSVNAYLRNFYFTNNFELLVFVFLTSFIFGAGALFVLVWNASIIGVYIGEVAHRLILTTGKLQAYFVALPVSLGHILIHGIPEFMAFFCAALGGGILSTVIIRRQLQGPQFIKIARDSAILFVLATFLLFVAAFLESL